MFNYYFTITSAELCRRFKHVLIFTSSRYIIARENCCLIVNQSDLCYAFVSKLLSRPTHDEKRLFLRAEVFTNYRIARLLRLSTKTKLVLRFEIRSYVCLGRQGKVHGNLTRYHLILRSVYFMPSLEHTFKTPGKNLKSTFQKVHLTCIKFVVNTAESHPVSVINLEKLLLKMRVFHTKISN